MSDATLTPSSFVSLRHKLLWPLLLIGILISLLGSWGMQYWIEFQFQEKLQMRLKTIASALIASADHVEARPEIQHMVNFLSAEPDLRQIILLAGEDPHEGLREIMVSKPDLVLLDLDMPGLSGIEILQQIRKMQSTHLQRVIMFTAHSEPETVKAILEMKVNDYLVKPFKASDLLRKVTQVLGRELFP